MSFLNSKEVAVIKSAVSEYPESPPFHPPCRFPELSFLPEFSADDKNHVYSAVRDSLKLLFPQESENQNWNPFAKLISPGNTVVLKPNFIREAHETKPDEWKQVITHGSVIRAICDYVLLALKGEGKVIICDAPQTDSSFDKICRVTGAKNVVDWYNSWSEIPVHLLDLRKEEWQSKDDVIIKRQKLSGDPQGYVAVNLGENSEFFGINPKHGFYGADYDISVTQKHHHDDVHEYLLAATVMNADVVINLPKLKTHKKTGITCAIKNLVGINGDKNWLPHYILGAPEEGGDQFPESGVKESSERVLMTLAKKILYHSPVWVNQLFRPIKKIGKVIFGDTHKVIRSGNWYGNDTTWRMSVDLNKCFFYWNSDAERLINNLMSEKVSRKYFALVDGIIAGEGEGPLAPDAKNCGVIIAGENPVAIDAVCAWLMGFNIEKIPFSNQAFKLKRLPLSNFSADEVQVISGKNEWQGSLSELKKNPPFSFKPHFGWKNVSYV